MFLFCMSSSWAVREAGDVSGVSSVIVMAPSSVPGLGQLLQNMHAE